MSLSGNLRNNYMSGIDKTVVGMGVPTFYGFVHPPISALPGIAGIPSAIQTFNKFTGQLGPRIDVANIFTNFVDQFNKNMAAQNGYSLPNVSLPNANLPITTQTYSNGKVQIALAGTEKDVLEAMNILNQHYNKQP